MMDKSTAQSMLGYDIAQLQTRIDAIDKIRDDLDKDIITPEKALERGRIARDGGW